MLDKRLGRGLKNLLSGGEDVSVSSELEIDSIIPNRLQPRKVFDPQHINELADSIRTHGVIQPIVVRKLSDGRTELISGERRLRAAKQAGLVKIPVVYRSPGSDREVLELAIIENLQRVDLDPIEKAKGFRQLAEEFGLTQEQIAERVGQDRSTVANFLRLLDLPVEIHEHVSRGTISSGHARALLSLQSKELQKKALKQILEKEMSVRDSESLIREIQGGLLIGQVKRRKNPLKPAWLSELEFLFEKQLGSRVRIRHGKSGRGKIQIEYASDEDLNRLAKRLGALDSKGMPGGGGSE